MTQTPQQQQAPQPQTSPALIYVAWAVVILPLVWALWQTFAKVVELFR